MSSDFKFVISAILAMFAIAALSLLLFPSWKFLVLGSAGIVAYKAILTYIAIGSLAGIVVNISKKRS